MGHKNVPLYFCPYPVAVLGPGRKGGGHRPPVLLQPPQFCGHPRFIAKITQNLIFFALPNFTKVGKLAASIECPKTKSASASEGFAPLTPHQGLCP